MSDHWPKDCHSTLATQARSGFAMAAEIIVARQCGFAGELL
jgi:hypothetical protein